MRRTCIWVPGIISSCKVMRLRHSSSRRGSIKCIVHTWSIKGLISELASNCSVVGITKNLAHFSKREIIY